MTIRELAEAICARTGEDIQVLTHRLHIRLQKRPDIPTTKEMRVIRDDGKRLPVVILDEATAEALLAEYVAKAQLKRKK
jgi:hypothetical protein